VRVCVPWGNMYGQKNTSDALSSYFEVRNQNRSVWA